MTVVDMGGVGADHVICTRDFLSPPFIPFLFRGCPSAYAVLAGVAGVSEFESEFEEEEGEEEEEEEEEFKEGEPMAVVVVCATHSRSTNAATAHRTPRSMRLS